MQNQQIQKILRYTVLFCLYAVVFAPLLLCADFFFPAIFPKAIYIRLLTEVALVAYIPLAILEPKYRPRFNIIYLSIAVFALIVVITSIFGENFIYSMWGNYERMDGIFSWAHYWALILIAASVLKEKKDWMKLFSFSLLCAVLMSFYGFFQRAGLNHFGPWTIYETNMGRITSTIGNPAFLAVYLLFNITFALLIIINKNISIWWCSLAGIALIPVFIAYMMTGVRGAAVGLILGVTSFAIGYLIWTVNKRKKIIIGSVFVLLVVIFGVLFLFRDVPSISQNQFFGRLFNMRISDSTVQTRLISWGMECEDGFATCGALRGIKENFWLGVGPQKFDIVFNKYFDPRFYTLVGTETWWDRAHNMILEVFATMGIFGLIAYLSVGFSMLYALFRIGTQQKEFRVEALIIFAFLGAYFIQNLFVFDTISSYIMLTIFVAYVIARNNCHCEEAPADEAIPSLIERVTGLPPRGWPALGWLRLRIRSLAMTIKPQYWWIGLVVAILVVVPCAYTYNIKLIQHNRMFLLNIAYANQKSLDDVLNSYREIVEISDFDNREVAIKLGQYMGQKVYTGNISVQKLKDDYSFVIKTMEESIEKNPKDVRLFLSYGNTLNVYAEIIKKYDMQESLRVLRKSEKVLQEAVELGRSRQQVFYSLANTYIISGNVEAGIEILEQAVEINENTPQAHWILSFAYAQAGEKENAIESAEAALEKGYSVKSEKEVITIANIYVEQNDYEGLLALYKEVAMDIKTGTAQAKVAATLAQMGRKDDAIEAAKEVVRRDPKLKDEVDEFIKQVETGEKVDFLDN